MMIPIPIRIRLSAVACEELLCSEEGRYEDAEGYRLNWESGDGSVDIVYTYLLARDALSRAQPPPVDGRWPPRKRLAIIVVRTLEEAVDLYYAVCSGTFQRSHFRVACRIADALREVVKGADPDIVRRWPAPYDQGDPRRA